MKKQIVISFALVVLSSLTALAQAQQQPKLDKASAAKIVQLLEESGHNSAIPGEAVRATNARNGRLSFCALVFFANATIKKPDI